MRRGGAHSPCRRCGDESFLQMSGAVAPLTVVSGNVDPPGMAPFRARIEIAGWRVLIQHVVWERGGPSPEVRDGLSREGADLVVFGHSHEPLCQKSGGTVFPNPGSCGPKRFSLPRTFGEAHLRPDEGIFRLLTWTRLRAPLLSLQRVSHWGREGGRNSAVLRRYCVGAGGGINFRRHFG